MAERATDHPYIPEIGMISTMSCRHEHEPNGLPRLAGREQHAEHLQRSTQTAPRLLSCGFCTNRAMLQGSSLLLPALARLLKGVLQASGARTAFPSVSGSHDA